jgi:halogenation protein CepH
VTIGGATRWWVPLMGRNDAGELFDQYAWQVRRSKFDAMLLDEATSRGARLLRGRALSPLVDDADAVRGVRIASEDGTELELEAEMVLDCSGQATFLAGQGITGPKYLGAYDKQIAIFSKWRASSGTMAPAAVTPNPATR